MKFGETITYASLGSKTATGKTTPLAVHSDSFTIQLKLSGTSGALLAAGNIEVTNDVTAEGPSPDNARWETLAFSLSGTGTGAGITADGASQAFAAAYRYVRINVTSISGTGATVEGFRAE